MTVRKYCTPREEKSKWEIEMLKESGDINKGCLKLLRNTGAWENRA